MQGKITIFKATDDDINVLSKIIKTAYQDVAQTFKLTKGNCPKHPSNCTDEWVKNDMDRGVTYYLLFENETPAGCAALENAEKQTSYLERLAVLPKFRHKGLGRMLVEHIFEKARQINAKTVGIGIIAEQEILKSWYETLGFEYTGTKKFDHLPFHVGFMNISL